MESNNLKENSVLNARRKEMSKFALMLAESVQSLTDAIYLVLKIFQSITSNCSVCVT